MPDAPSPRPGHEARSDSQVPATEEEKARGNSGNYPPQCKPTKEWPDDREDGGAGPTAANGGSQNGGAPPPSSPRRPEALEGGAGAGDKKRPPSPEKVEEAGLNGEGQPEDPSGASLTPLTDTLTDSRWTALLEAAGLGSDRADGTEPPDQGCPSPDDGQPRGSSPPVLAPETDPAQPRGRVPTRRGPTMPVEDPFKTPPQMPVTTDRSHMAPRGGLREEQPPPQGVPGCLMSSDQSGLLCEVGPLEPCPLHKPQEGHSCVVLSSARRTLARPPPQDSTTDSQCWQPPSRPRRGEWPLPQATPGDGERRRRGWQWPRLSPGKAAQALSPTC